MIKIYTMTHKAFTPPKDDLYIPMQVGKALHQDLGFVGDDTGDHISTRNPYYSELTGLYWIWKNEKRADYVGLCHYRRYLLDDQERLFTRQSLAPLLERYDVITTKLLRLNFTYYDGYAINHHIEDLIATGDVIREKYPEIYPYYERIVHDKYTYFGNMMICKKEILDAYCAFLFDVFFEVEKRVDHSEYDDYHKRVYGFISEILLLVYLRAKKLKVYECKVGMYGEKAENIALKNQLATFFENRDVAGAKACFLQVYEKRPDILMEASDIYGDLKATMQLISTCEYEGEAKDGLLERGLDYRALIDYMKRLNDIVEQIKQDDAPISMQDKHWLRQNKPSQAAVEIAVLLHVPEQLQEKVRKNIDVVIKTT